MYVLHKVAIVNRNKYYYYNTLTIYKPWFPWFRWIERHKYDCNEFLKHIKFKYYTLAYLIL